MFQLGAEACGPEDDVRAEQAAVCQPDAVGLYAGEHGAAFQYAARGCCPERGRPDETGHGDHALRRQAPPHAVLHEGDGVMTRLRSNPASRHTGSRRVNQLVDVTFEISSSSPTAEMPPPTTMTCSPRNSSAET